MHTSAITFEFINKSISPNLYSCNYFDKLQIFSVVPVDTAMGSFPSVSFSDIMSLGVQYIPINKELRSLELSVSLSLDQGFELIMKRT